MARGAAGGGGGEGDVKAKEKREDALGRAADGALLGKIFGRGGRVLQGQPGGIAVGGGGERTPEIVSVFCIPGGDAGISHRDVEHGEHAGGLEERAVARVGDLRGDLVPVAGGGECAGAVGPEVGDGGLIGGAGGAAV